MKRILLIAKGKVQKVGYRDFVQDSAREQGITGYVKNLEDGNVKVVGEGKEAEINAFINGITVKKDFIDVVDTSVEYGEPTGEFSVFKILYGEVAEELGDRLGAALLYLGATNQKIDAGFKMLGEKQDQMLEKQDMSLEKQDMMLEKQDQMLEKQDVMIGKQDMMLEKQDMSLEKQDQMLEKQDMSLEKQDMMLEKQDVMLEKQDVMLEKQDMSLEKQDTMIGKQDMMLEKQDMSLEKQDGTIGAIGEVAEKIDRGKDEIVTEIKTLRDDLRSYMETKFARIEHEIEGIKVKIGMV